MFKQDLKNEQDDNRQTIVNNIFASNGYEVITIDTRNKEYYKEYLELQKKGVDKKIIDKSDGYTWLVDEKYYKQQLDNKSCIYLEIESHNKTGWLFDESKETTTLCFIYLDALILLDYKELRDKVIYYYDYLVDKYGIKNNKYKQGAFIPMLVSELDILKIEYEIAYFNDYKQ